ncbi:hypothetical protein GOL29_31820 [Sinorhizobium medicae]|nr:hypothetical protein [Sinorhizobium medicae]
MKTSLAPSTRRKHLSALDHLYDSVQRQRGSDCLDRLIAEADADALEDCLVGFLAQLGNEAAVTNVDKTSTWTSAVSFMSDMLRFSGNSGARACKMEARLLRIDTLYRQLAPNPATPAPPVRALPPSVVEDLYEIFRPDSPGNPFKTEALRWRNLLIFMLLLRLGLRGSEAARQRCSTPIPSRKTSIQRLMGRELQAAFTPPCPTASRAARPRARPC